MSPWKAGTLIVLSSSLYLGCPRSLIDSTTSHAPPGSPLFLIEHMQSICNIPLSFRVIRTVNGCNKFRFWWTNEIENTEVFYLIKKKCLVHQVGRLYLSQGSTVRIRTSLQVLSSIGAITGTAANIIMRYICTWRWKSHRLVFLH